jgi:hypothetical protein
VNWAITEKGYSQRRACRLVGIDPRVYRYRSTRGDDGPLRQRLRELSSERRRFGYAPCETDIGRIDRRKLVAPKRIPIASFGAS